jgi:hypothetical protein
MGSYFTALHNSVMEASSRLIQSRHFDGRITMPNFFGEKTKGEVIHYAIRINMFVNRGM